MIAARLAVAHDSTRRFADRASDCDTPANEANERAGKRADGFTRPSTSEPTMFAVALLPRQPGPDASGPVAVPGRTKMPSRTCNLSLLDELAGVLELHFGDRVQICEPLPPRPDDEPAALRFGRLTLDLARHEVTVDNRLVTLTKSEFDLLVILARRPGVVLSRREIVIASKGPNYPVDDRSIDVQMFNLRRKLGPVGRRLQTVRSVGYRFLSEGA
jgi:hypothetical protein